MSPLVVVAVTVALVAASAFFVATEFALVSAKRHRIEELAPTSRSARAALRSGAELTLLLAGSQLGITVCTLALGAITKPAVHHALTPLLEVTGMPYVAADIAAFVAALVVVTFIHLVVGEMAPKSWAIAHPERSAMLLAIPMRGFLWVTRPLLRMLNGQANGIVRRLGVEPVDEVNTGQDPDALRHLVEHSAEVGALDPLSYASLSRVLDLRAATMADLLDGGEVTALAPDATAGQARDLARSSGHLRLIIGTAGRYTGVLHVRDTLLAPGPDAPVAPYVRPLLGIAADTPLTEATHLMRVGRHHIALVTGEDGRVGVVTLADLLPRLLALSGEPRSAESSGARPDTGAGSIGDRP
ncbi:CNNM domain-containing protein [Georgenia sp. Z1491]|uniref:CNNM domain-containing protein n=1 Tax=Georgenia sp. Z1491 TaxID=3416707 RepID=UPI003CFA7252